ncbi:MAG: HAMP domain-containing histidine kinase [Balneola sp.]
METFYHCLDLSQEVVFSNFPSELTNLIGSEKNQRSPINVIFLGKKVKARFAYKSNYAGTLFICTVDSKYVDSYKKFKELTKLSMISLDSVIHFKREITTSQNDLTQELIHNLTSLNTHNIQGLFALVPQKLLSQNLNSQSNVVKEIISKKPNITVNTLLRQIKNNLAMKVEFSVFEKTLKQYPSVELVDDSIRDTVLSILQIFILDFEDKEIEVRLGSCEKRLHFDFDTLSVSLYYLFDNAVKYCCPKSILNISFKEEADAFTLNLDMLSLKIEDREVQSLFDKGYRSESAKMRYKKGTGIGLFKLKKTLQLNNAILEINPRSYHKTRQIGEFKFESNNFKVKFMNQQNWFEANKLI